MRPGDRFCVRDMDWLANIRGTVEAAVVVAADIEVVTGFTSGGGVE